MKKIICVLMLTITTLSAFADNAVISTTNAPSAIGPYSQAILSNDFLFLSGQIGIDPKTGTLQPYNGDISSQAKQVLSNIDAILGAAGCKKSNVIKATVLLTNINDFETMNKVYSEYFGTHKPARSAYAVAALPKGAHIEIEMIAACNS